MEISNNSKPVILVIDNEERFARSIATLLRGIARVVLCTGPHITIARVLDEVCEFIPDLIISDVNLGPDKELMGAEIVKEIRKQLDPNQKFILMSAQSHESVAHELRVKFYGKSRPDQFWDMVKSLLQH